MSHKNMSLELGSELAKTVLLLLFKGAISAAAVVGH
jgi:hypothetical protein